MRRRARKRFHRCGGGATTAFATARAKEDKVKKIVRMAAVAALVGFQLAPGSASSHREAPLISQDPTADNTDVYAFVSPDRPDSVTMIANYIPLEQPAGGPNF